MSRFGTPDGPWCKVEIMGHVEHLARAKEVPLLDGKALRVCDETESKPILYGLGAIFSLTWLTDEEGERESTTRIAEQIRRDTAVAWGAKIGGLQQKIRDVVGDRKMSKMDIFNAVGAVTPELAEPDFAEAFEGSWLTHTPDDDTLWWLDPADCPF